MANQKERFQPESGAITFVFMLFSQASEDRHFTKHEISFDTALGAARTIHETTGPLNCLTVEGGTRSKRNFHRPESNCGVAISCSSEAFIVDQQTSQMLAPPRLFELIRNPRIMATAVPSTTTALMNGLSVANQKFVFMLFISSFRRSTFRKFPRIGGPRITRIYRMDEEFRLLVRSRSCWPNRNRTKK